MTSRLSGLQKDVLALYRSILREAIRKDQKALQSISSTPSSSHNDVNRLPLCELFSTASSVAFARDKFRSEALVVRRSDFKTIEYKIRKGKKQLELLKMPGVNLVGGA